MPFFAFLANNRPRIGSATLSFLVALFLLVVLNRTFWVRADTYLAGNIVTLSALAIGLLALFTAVLTAVSVKYVTKPVFMLLILTASLAAWFTDNYGVIVDTEMIRNVLETTGPESGRVLTPGLFLHIVLTAVFPCILLAWTEILHRSFWSKVAWNLAIILPCLLAFAISAMSQARVFASTVRTHKDLARVINPFVPLASAVHYTIDRGGERHLLVEPLGSDAKRVSVGIPSQKPRVTIIVAGEAARSADFSLGGYSRETNPELKAQKVLYFPDTTSCGTATAVSLPCMFSVYTRKKYTHLKGLSTETLPDVLSHAGINIAWWDNNTGSKGVADRIAFVNLPAIKDPRFCKDGECQDGIFLDRVDAWLDTIKGDSVLVLHQLGSHGPAYSLRYPDEFRRFQPDCRSVEFTACTQQEIINAYDNTILYTDHILAGIIDRLKCHGDKIAASMLYMSDHGESLGENSVYLHGMPYFIAPKEQTHIPFVLWFDNDFAATTGVERSCVEKTLDQPRSHDNLFQSVLGMMNVETSIYDASLDVLASCRLAPMS
ncbi:lipid A ethanolaminephosphotransferase [Pararhizobium capsulatum DSM 1112]|uniref:Lipid A ethanolaminephosphotransferase n=1 Tax=Pararhizobium capsulatum DSM 1112 TaxID=1121113 RepID=A0ABU0BIU2_9HYPH|nr:phosphoethanolamine--lipid A transferase [Pararhizobium capsulatum]MDQ0318176.1 lipid A ethanolaminephosphotransferase [Pararhizobium capsulatum DSM 1112]